ncbi:MAG: hypothetical protein MMC33_009337 [Icmadophila ericetorum]|nr:hypothetical protein [Icmadophila ericetorum]
MAFTIRPAPATAATARTIREIEVSALEESALARLLWSPPPPSTVTETTPTQLNSSPSTTSPAAVVNIDRELIFLQDPANHYLLATDTANAKDVGYVWWQYTKGRTKAQWAETYTNRYRPEGMKKVLADATTGAQFLKRAELLGDRDVFTLKELYVHPHFQRCGVGSMLVEWGVKKADECGLMAYTEASPQGLGLYLKYGFEEVDRHTVDLEPWGGRKGEESSYGLLLRKVRVGK